MPHALAHRSTHATVIVTARSASGARSPSCSAGQKSRAAAIRLPLFRRQQVGVGRRGQQAWRLVVRQPLRLRATRPLGRAPRPHFLGKERCPFRLLQQVPDAQQQYRSQLGHRPCPDDAATDRRRAAPLLESLLPHRDRRSTERPRLAWHGDVGTQHLVDLTGLVQQDVQHDTVDRAVRAEVADCSHDPGRLTIAVDAQQREQRAERLLDAAVRRRGEQDRRSAAAPSRGSGSGRWSLGSCVS